MRVYAYVYTVQRCTRVRVKYTYSRTLGIGPTDFTLCTRTVHVHSYVSIFEGSVHSTFVHSYILHTQGYTFNTVQVNK